MARKPTLFVKPPEDDELPRTLLPQGWPRPQGYANGMTAKGRVVVTGGVVGAADEERGQIVKAYVVLRAGHNGDASMARALQDHVKAAIAPYKYPRAVEFVGELPKTQTGKLQRFELRKLAGEQASRKLAS